MLMLTSFILWHFFTGVIIEFETENVSVIESDGSVTVNLVRTGNHSNIIIVCINITRVVENATNTQRTYVLM